MLNLLHKYHKPVPRYTSYPTAPHWKSFSEIEYKSVLQSIVGPLSLYFHIPFCKTMCLFCGCSVILNRKEENEVRYVDFLKKEIDLVGRLLNSKKVSQIHFGGGTPTKLSICLLEDLFRKIDASFERENDAEIAIEIDPRTVHEDNGEKLQALKKLGVNRVSFGVQDTNWEVQKAIKRFQSLEMTKQTFVLAKQMGFEGINIDLIYGLPKQTKTSFEKTIEEILNLRPDRIALFSYAKVPWLKQHQLAIKDSDLPELSDKFAIYEMARSSFIQAGYVAIGMDHFALPHDELALSFKEKTLQRNFQGYTINRAENFLGFGVTAIGCTKDSYFQNSKDLSFYYELITQNKLPCHKGIILTRDDQIRKWVIQTLMCQFELDKKAFYKQFFIEFDLYFASVDLIDLENEGFIENSLTKLKVLPMGELFIRNIACLFDSYLNNEKQLFSQSI